MKKILLVEDTELNIDLMTQLLEDEYELIFARNGQLGIDLANAQQPDLILMDISLPVMDGYEATRQIRKTIKTTPIIGLSAHAMDGHEQKAIEAGCNDYLTKPVDEGLLFKMLDKYLKVAVQ